MGKQECRPAALQALEQEHSNLHSGTRTTVASTHVTQHATANMPCLQAHEALSDPTSRPASVHPAAHANAPAPARARTHTHTHTHTERHTHRERERERERDTHTHTHTHTNTTDTHTHTHTLVFGTHVTMCSPTIRYPRHRRVLHHTTYDRLCSVCSFSSVLNGNVGCSAHLRTAAERHSPRFGFRERSVFQSDHHVQNKTKARTPLAHRTRRPRLT